MLAARGHEVESALNGSEGLKRLAAVMGTAHDFDIVLCDFQMPVRFRFPTCHVHLSFDPCDCMIVTLSLLLAAIDIRVVLVMIGVVNVCLCDAGNGWFRDGATIPFSRSRIRRAGRVQCRPRRRRFFRVRFDIRDARERHCGYCKCSAARVIVGPRAFASANENIGDIGKF
jgi:hypothetical protein